MFHFSHLLRLHHQYTLLQTILPSQEFFFVGGVIRDILLGIDKQITDIDITGPNHPEQRRETMQLPDTGRARFRTEKFGTMSIIQKTDPEISYEITPFREESGYADNRHPDEIVRSHDLLADSKRRDFTINALYRSPRQLPHNKTLPVSSSLIHRADDSHLLVILKQHGGCILIDQGIIVLQDQYLIKCFLAGDLPTLPQVMYTTSDTKDTHTAGKIVQISGVLIDPQDGLRDLLHRKIRAVGSPEDRFTEDALRILRGVRFVNMLNQQLPDPEKQNSAFDFEKKTRQGMEKTAPLVQEISAERCHAECMKVFAGSNPFGYIALLRELQLLEILFPALAKTIDNRQPVRYHPFDTYSHTLLTLWHLQQLCSDPLVKFAMLYHDVGKPEQYAFMDEAIAQNPENPDRTGYIAHPEISVRLAREDFTHLAFSGKQIDQICRYIKRHHRPGEILDSKPETRTKKLRELLSEGGFDATMNLLTIAIADRSGQFNPLQKPALQELELLKTMLQELYASEGQFTMQQLAVTGTDLMHEFSLTPGPIIGELLQKAFARVMDEVTTRNEKMHIISYLKTLPESSSAKNFNCDRPCQ